jgi:hypothetical protein
LAEVVTRYVADVSDFQAKLKEVEASVKDVEQASVSSQKKVNKEIVDAASKRKQLIKEEEADLKELEKRRKGSFSVKEIKEYNKSIAETKDRIKTLKGENGGLSKSFDGIPGPIGKVVTGLKSATTAARAFIATPLGLILAAISVAIFAVSAAFRNSEEGQNKFNKIAGVTSAILGNIVDLFADLGEKIIGAFENPKEAISGLYEFLKSQLLNRVLAVPEIFMGVWDTVASSFSAFSAKFRTIASEIPIIGKGIDKEKAEKDFSEATDNILAGVKRTANGIIQLQTGVVDFLDKATDATKKFIKENEREAKLAAQVADDRAKADKIERDLIVERAKLESKIADLKLKSRQIEQFNAEQRRDFILEAQKLEEGLLSKEQEVLKLRRDAISLENTFARSSKENLKAEAEAKAAVFQVEARRLEQARSTQRELNRLNGEIEKDRDELNKSLVEARIASITDARERELQALDETFKEKISKIKGESEEENELRSLLLQQRLDAEAQINKKFDETEEQARLQAIENNNNREIIELENQVLRLGNTQLNKQKEINQKIIDLKVSFLDDERKLIENSTEITEDLRFLLIAENEKKILELKKGSLEEQNELQRFFSEDSLQIAAQFSDAINNLNRAQTDARIRMFEEQKDAGIITEEEFLEKKKQLAEEQARRDKAAAIIQAIINTALAVSAGLSKPAVPPFPTAIAAGILGGIQIATIASQPLPKFASGTEFLKRGKNKPGIDTIPILANEGEAIIKTSENAKYPGLAKAWNSGKLDKFLHVNYVLPEIRKEIEKHRKRESASFAENIANSIMMGGGRFNDLNIVDGLKSTNKNIKEQTHVMKTLFKNYRTNPYKF